METSRKKPNLFAVHKKYSISIPGPDQITIEMLCLWHDATSGREWRIVRTT